MSLYRHIALRTTRGGAPFKYLGVIDDKSKYSKSYLAYSTDAVLNPNAKFALENGPDGLVHIRSCRNHKYWARSSVDEHWLVAEVGEPMTDTSAWNCTLFRMDVGDDNRATFFHVQSGRTVKIQGDALLSVDPDATTGAISTLVDYDTLVVLPPLVAFKGDNGLYYKCERPLLTLGKFKSEDIGDSDNWWSISTTNDAYIRVRCHGGKNPWTWRSRTRKPNVCPAHVVGEWGENVDDDSRQLFSVVKVAENVIALRNVVTNNFCSRGSLTISAFYSLFEFATLQDVLTLDANSITKEAQLLVEEPVLSRRVEVIKFDLANARTYNVTPLSTVKVNFENLTNVEQLGQLDLTMSITKTSKWTNSINLKLGVKTTFATGVPFISEGKIEVSAQASYGYQWQDCVEETHQLGSIYTVKVPPMMKVVGEALATKGTCDVPFSYHQIDLLTNGETRRTSMNDGVFTGVSAFNFNYKVRYLPLD